MHSTKQKRNNIKFGIILALIAILFFVLIFVRKLYFA
jgi:hypothetical protein